LEIDHLSRVELRELRQREFAEKPPPATFFPSGSPIARNVATAGFSIVGMTPKWSADLGLPARRQLLCATFCTSNQHSIDIRCARVSVRS
jgi:hypothetical protein